MVAFDNVTAFDATTEPHIIATINTDTNGVNGLTAFDSLGTVVFKVNPTATGARTT